MWQVAQSVEKPAAWWLGFVVLLKSCWLASDALGRGIGEIAGDVALVALDRAPHRQREEVMHHVGRVPTTTHLIVALNTISGESIGDMVRRLCGHVVVLVTTEAIITDAVELQWVAGSVTICTAQATMRTHEGETVLLVQLRDVVHDPIHRCMAACAIISNAHSMHTLVLARSAIHGSRIEY